MRVIEALDGERTTLGVPTLEEVVETTPVEQLDSVVRRLRAFPQLVARDAALAHRSGRWVPGRPDPTEYVPGDICATRSIIGASLLQEHLAARDQLKVADRDRSDGAAILAVTTAIAAGMLMEAEPFFLDSDTADGLLRSSPPPPEAVASLRLPYPRVLIHFSREFELPDPFVVPPGRGSREESEGASLFGYRMEVDRAIATRGGSVTGIVLSAGPGGVGVADDVLWLMSADPDDTLPPPANLDRQRGAQLARLSRSLLSDAIYNLAASVAWMEWTAPERELLPMLSDKEWRKVARTSRFRKLERAGRFIGVHVIDKGAQPSRSVSKPTREGPRRKSPVAHLREGHWRSVRVATRDANGMVIGDVHGTEGVDWHYEGRWIAPTVVHPTGQPRDGIRVYRLPAAPPEARHD